MSNTIYLDVRRDDEWEAGHVKGAIHFELDKLQMGELPDVPKDSEIQTYCRAGGRAGIAKNILIKAGFSNVTNAGGLELLRIKGLPIE